MGRRLLVDKKIFTCLVSLEHLQHVLGVLGAVVLAVGVLAVPVAGDVVDGEQGGAGVTGGAPSQTDVINQRGIVPIK